MSDDRMGRFIGNLPDKHRAVKHGVINLLRKFCLQHCPDERSICSKCAIMDEIIAWEDVGNPQPRERKRNDSL